MIAADPIRLEVDPTTFEGRKNLDINSERQGEWLQSVLCRSPLTIMTSIR